MYKYYRKITIDYTKVSGSSNHTNFPILFSETSNWLKTIGNGGQIENNNGYDIIFMDENGSNQLSHEIIYYSGTTGQFTAYIKIPTLKYNEDTIIRIYYGNSSINSSQESISDTWNSDYKGVWHLKESGNGTLGEFKDSSGNGNDGQGGAGDSDSTPTRVWGAIGYAQSFDGIDDFIDLPALSNTDEVTVECLFKYSVNDGVDGIVSSAAWDLGTAHFHLDSNTAVSGVNGGEGTVSGTLTSGTWYHCAYTFEKSGDIILYMNGTAVDTADAAPYDWLGGVLEIGHEYTDYEDRYFDGIIGNVAISDVVRSPDWIATKYNSQSKSSWTPAEITTLGWWDASDESSISGSPSVTQINDKSGNNAHLENRNGNPTTGTRTQNGLNVLDHDGTTWMEAPSMTFPASGNVAFFMVAVIDVIDNDTDAIYGLDNDTPAECDFRSGSNGQFNGKIYADGIGTNIDLTGGPFHGPSIYNSNFDWGSSTISAYIDGSCRGSNESYNIVKISTTTDFHAFAKLGNALQRPDGAWGEMIIVEDVTSATREKIEGYLAWKWGIEANLPSDHPYKDAAPTFYLIEEEICLQNSIFFGCNF